MRQQLRVSGIKSLSKCALLAILIFPIPATANQKGMLPLSVEKEFDLPTPGAAVAVTWSSDSSKLAAVSNYGQAFTVWDKAGHLVNRFTRHGGGPTLSGSLEFVDGSAALVFPPAGDAANNASFSIWDVKSGHAVATLDGPEPGRDYPLNRASHFMATPDQHLLAVSTNAVQGPPFEKNIMVYDAKSWHVIQTAKVYPGITSLCIFGQGKLLGVGTVAHGRVSILDLNSGSVIQEIQGYDDSKYGAVALDAVAGSPDGQLIMVGAGLPTLHGASYGTPEQGAWQKSIESVKIFRVKDRAEFASLSAGELPIRQAKWDPKGRFVAFIDGSKGLFLWAPWTHEGYQRIELPSLSLSLAIAPNGSAIAVTTDQGVRVFSVH